MGYEVQKHLSAIAGILPTSPRKHEIGLYLRLRLNRGSELDAMAEELGADILRIIPEVVSGRMYSFDVLNFGSRANGDH